MTEKLEHTVAELAYARENLGRIKDNIQQLQLEMGQTHLGQEFASAQMQRELGAQRVGELEAMLRTDALAAFDGEDRHPHAAVTIKEFMVLKYNLEEALEHARFHLPQAVKLNKREFDKIARVTNFSFVEKGKEHRATITRDLSEWVSPAPEKGNG